MPASAFSRTLTADPIVLASGARDYRRATPATSAAARAQVPHVTKAGVPAGQAGYIHYFVITGPDGEPESQVGIELADGGIAWSFPDVGVFVSPFVGIGTLLANGKQYGIEHLYGLRPFSDPRAMRAFQRDLPARLAPWLEAKVPYCAEELPLERYCVSCLGFTLRVLYPGRTHAALPAVPSDLKTVQKHVYTTEDLLLYLAGIALDAPREQRIKRIQALAVPENLREQLVRIASDVDAATPAGKTEVARASPSKRRAAAPAVMQLPKRVVPRRRS